MGYKSGMAGILLAGGLSSRYGSPKAFAKWNGKFFYEIVYSVLQRVCDTVIIVTRPEFVHRFPKNYAVIVDQAPFAGCGPLAGIYSGMTKIRAANYVILPCDMPNMDVDTMEKLVHSHRTDVTLAVAKGRIQPLVSVWSGQVSSTVKTALVNRQFKMSDILEKLQTTEMDGATLATDSRVFMNINTLEEDQDLREGIGFS